MCEARKSPSFWREESLDQEQDEMANYTSVGAFENEDCALKKTGLSLTPGPAAPIVGNTPYRWSGRGLG